MGPGRKLRDNPSEGGVGGVLGVDDIGEDPAAPGDNCDRALVAARLDAEDGVQASVL
jgi:hypothetical protein